MKTERIDKILSNHGYGTRKEVRKLLHSGVVVVDGDVCCSPDTHIDPEFSIISVDGETVPLRQYVYLMLNKPAGVVCSSRDGFRNTVFDLLDSRYRAHLPGGELHMVGRLDLDTEGLLLLTTDGALTHRLTSPKTHVSKTYYVRLRDEVPVESQLLITRRFSDGVHIDADGDDGEYDCKPAGLTWLDGCTAQLVITEGRYHQVKRMFAAAGNEVSYLRRTAIGNLELDPSLETGQYRELSSSELDLLK